jgi:predicted RecB family nuclease
MSATRLDKSTLVTSRLFESYLACPTKCYLQFIGEPAVENDFATWRDKHRKSYCLDGFRHLKIDHSQTIDGGEPDAGHWARARWDFAFNQIVRAQHYEAHIHAVQRVRVGGPVATCRFIPIHFVPQNKLSRSDKLLAAFEALVLAKAVGSTVGTAKIVHGDQLNTFRVKADQLLPIIIKTVSRITSAMCAGSPPDLILNNHCRECDFQTRCRLKATETDDLSLLANMSPKERARLNRKGIFPCHTIVLHV